MNGKKVLEGLIKLFVVLNLGLFVFNYVSRSNEYLLSEERIEHITQLLEQEGINIDTELIRDFSPKRSADLQYIGDGLSIRDEIVKRFFNNDLASVKRFKKESETNAGGEMRYYTLNNETLIFDKYALMYENESNQSNEASPTIDQAKKMCMNLLKRINYASTSADYEIEVVEHENYLTLTYFLTLDEIPILDAYMTFDVYKAGVASGTMYLGKIEITSEKGKEIYPIDLVLFGIEEYMLENQYKNISDITLVYKRAKSEDNIWGQKIIPVYKIEFDGLNQALFVNAYNNEILG